jgi:hypothetical protein
MERSAGWSAGATFAIRAADMIYTASWGNAIPSLLFFLDTAIIGVEADYVSRVSSHFKLNYRACQKGGILRVWGTTSILRH